MENLNSQSTDHVHFPKGYNATKILKQAEKEAMDLIEGKQRMDNDLWKEVEIGTNLGVYNFNR